MAASPPFHPDALRDRVAVVTGASGGIGLAICEQLQALGAQVVQVDIAYPAEPSDAGERRLAVQVDIANPASVASLGALVRSRFGRCDVLVNNAAITAPATPLESFPLDLWDRVFAVNLRGALSCAQALVPSMLESGAGSIVNIASIAAQSPSRAGAYGPAKAGLVALTRQMALEWRPRGVRANAVSPGMVRTPLSEKHYQQVGKLQEREAKIPARRIGLPEDIAGAVAFLATDASSYVNGEDIVVDGGFLKASLLNLY